MDANHVLYQTSSHLNIDSKTESGMSAKINTVKRMADKTILTVQRRNQVARLPPAVEEVKAMFLYQ